MKKEKKKNRNSYSQEFKIQAIDLAKEIGTKEAAEKLGIDSSQTIGAWVRYTNKMEESSEFQELEVAKTEIKRLKKQAAEDKKVIAILKDAAAFFCQDHLK